MLSVVGPRCLIVCGLEASCASRPTVVARARAGGPAIDRRRQVGLVPRVPGPPCRRRCCSHVHRQRHRQLRRPAPFPRAGVWRLPRRPAGGPSLRAGLRRDLPPGCCRPGARLPLHRRRGVVPRGWRGQWDASPGARPSHDVRRSGAGVAGRFRRSARREVGPLHDDAAEVECARPHLPLQHRRPLGFPPGQRQSRRPQNGAPQGGGRRRQAARRRGGGHGCQVVGARFQRQGSQGLQDALGYSPRRFHHPRGASVTETGL